LKRLQRNPNEPEFLQAVLEVAETVIPFIEENKNTKTKCFWKEWLSLTESLLSCSLIDDKELLK
jgi:glutamate dehydrogenase (NADP+)